MVEVKKTYIEFKLDGVGKLTPPEESHDNLKKAMKAQDEINQKQILTRLTKLSKQKHEPIMRELFTVIDYTNLRMDAICNAINFQYQFIRTAIMTQFHATRQMDDAIDDLKKDPTKKETLDKIDSLRKEHSHLYEKYDKIEPIVNGVNEIIQERKKSMEN